MATTGTRPEPPLVVIVGPTASGKTALAVELAKQQNGEIICADSRTIYRGMDIGTAKPSVEECQSVPHWGLDLVSPGERFTVADFQRYANQKINEIRQRGHLPIIVGGTGLYVDAVIYNYVFSDGYDEHLRKQLGKMEVSELLEYCAINHVGLSSIDPTKRRIIRQIERNNNQNISKKIVRKNTKVVGIATNKYELQNRITQRSEQIFTKGVVEEAKMLGNLYGWQSEAMTGNIYPIIRQFIDKQITFEELRSKFIVRDRQLAKRQMTWFRRDPNILWGTSGELGSHLNTYCDRIKSNGEKADSHD